MKETLSLHEEVLGAVDELHNVDVRLQFLFEVFCMGLDHLTQDATEGFQAVLLESSLSVGRIHDKLDAARRQ